MPEQLDASIRQPAPPATAPIYHSWTPPDGRDGQPTCAEVSGLRDRLAAEFGWES